MWWPDNIRNILKANISSFQIVLYITPGIRRRKSNKNTGTFSEIRRFSSVWI
jgi:hypothetical protein